MSSGNWQTFFVKNQRVNTSFGLHMVSDTTIQLCKCSAKGTMDDT